MAKASLKKSPPSVPRSCGLSVPLAQRKACDMKPPSGSPGPSGLENRTTSPDALMTRGAPQVAPAVDAGGEALVAAERGQRLHHAILPYEPTTDMAGHAGEKRRATPLFPQWVEVGSLGDAYDRALVVEPGPNHAAVARWTVRPPERAEVAYRSVAPQGRMPGVVPGQVGEARYPAAIVDRRAPARHSTERRGALGDRVLRVRA